MNMQASVYDDVMDQSPSPEKHHKNEVGGLKGSGYRSPDEEIGGYQAAGIAEGVTNLMHQVMMIQKTACKRKQPLLAPGIMNPQSPPYDPIALLQQQPDSPQQWGQQELHQGFGSALPWSEHEDQQSKVLLQRNSDASPGRQDVNPCVTSRNVIQIPAVQYNPSYLAAQHSSFSQMLQPTTPASRAHGGAENQQQVALHNPHMALATMFMEMSEAELQLYVSTHPAEVLRPMSRVEVSATIIRIYN